MSKAVFRLTPDDFMDEVVDGDIVYTEITCDVDKWKCCECKMPVGFTIHTNLDNPMLSGLIWTNTWANPETGSYYCEDCTPEAE